MSTLNRISSSSSDCCSFLVLFYICKNNTVERYISKVQWKVTIELYFKYTNIYTSFTYKPHFTSIHSFICINASPFVCTFRISLRILTVVCVFFYIFSVCYLYSTIANPNMFQCIFISLCLDMYDDHCT